MTPLNRFGSASDLADWVSDARARTFELVADLTDEQLMGPQLSIVNPLLWEIGHHAWFQSRWVLRQASGQKPVREDEDTLYDSIAIPHGTRWDLPLPSREETLAYMREVRDRVLELLQAGEPSDEQAYHIIYTTFHEDMHTEALTYARQTHGYPPPRLSIVPEPEDQPAVGDGSLSGDVEISGGKFMLGASREDPFPFDNEKWAHTVELETFSLARAPVTQADFTAFVADGGYRRQELWSQEGWSWRETANAEHPVYWRGSSNAEWFRRHFDRWVPLEPHRPVLHVNWHEAEAYCCWAGRRLPTEAEWEMAAASEPNRISGGLAPRKRPYPWGDEAPAGGPANLDWGAMGCVDVGAFSAGDSAIGCRQMIGNVWEWTSSVFLPYPEFVPDPYKEYSEPWFETRKVLRGGCWATRSRLIRNTYRNYYTPDRRDVWAGFRTCAP